VNKLNLFFQLTKIDVQSRSVTGIATAELPDKSGEICDYEGTKPYYQKWSDGFKKATDGNSLGNLRAMHEPIAAGKLTDIKFNDAEKSIEITAKVIDEDSWNKCLEFVYTGFSQGGDYVRRWKDGDLMRYIADPAEVSLVDNPCLAAATMQIVKADGTIEMRKFQTKETPMTVEQVWKAADGSTHKTKAEALKKNIDIEADAAAAAAVAETQQAIQKAMETLDEKDPLYWETDLYKRDFTDEERTKAAESGEAMSDGSFPIKTTTDLENAIHAYGRAKDKAKAKEHIIARAKALGATDKLPSDWEGSTQKDEAAEKAAQAEALKAEKAEKKAEVTKLAKGETFDASEAICALQTIEWLCAHEMMESETGDDDDKQQVIDLQTVIERLKTFIASEITEDLRVDGSLAAALGVSFMKKKVDDSEIATEHAEEVSKIHGHAMKIMDHVQKCMSGKDGVEKSEHHTEADHEHVEKIHGHASDVADKCMKMLDKEAKPMSDEHKEHVNDIHKAATNVMDTAHKFLKGTDKAEHHTEADKAALHKIHGHAQDIAEKCVKIFGEGKPKEGNGEDEVITKLAKSEAANQSLHKALGDVNATVGDLLKRIDHLERQPAVRKGAIFAVEREGNEVQPGTEPVDAKPVGLKAQRLSPEEQRGLIQFCQ
jgi:hypothetical protein